MIDYKVGWTLRVDLLRIASKPLDGISHGGKVDDRGDAGEVLEDDAGRPEGNLHAQVLVVLPVQNLVHVRPQDLQKCNR